MSSAFWLLIPVVLVVVDEDGASFAVSWEDTDPGERGVSIDDSAAVDWLLYDQGGKFGLIT